MPQREVNYTEHLGKTLASLSDPGALLVSADASGKPNAMTIGWGTAGVVWGKSIFMVAVRPSRYTHDLIRARGEFTVNVMPAGMAEVVAYCGSHSGRDHDKLAEKGLTPAAGKTVSVPTIEQAVVAYECRVVHTNHVIAQNLAADIVPGFYPQGDYHTVFFGEILACLAE